MISSLGKILPFGNRAWAGLGFLIYALFYFVLIFQFRVLRTDDFGYIRSVLGTLERGRLYTYEYLAPYSATLSAMSALAYHCTGNYYTSTYGVLAFSALLTFVLLRTLLARSMVAWQATALTFIFMTMPLLQVKAADYHGSMPNLALFLAAILLFNSNRMNWFFGVSFLAFANRQSHVVLLILPLYIFATEYRASGRLHKSIVLNCVLFVAAGLALHFYLNKTYTQTHAMSIAFDFKNRLSAFLEAAMAGGFVSLGVLSLFGVLFRSPLGILKENFRNWLAPVILSLLLITFTLLFWRLDLVCNDTTFFGYLRWGTFNKILPWALLISFWFLDYQILKPTPYLLLVAGFILSISPKGMWWDYYFLEIIVLGLLITLQYRAGKTPTGYVGFYPKVKWILVFLLAANLAYAYALRLGADRDALFVSVYEKMERAGKISPAQMTRAPYGYLGWKLFDYYISHEGHNFDGVAGFLQYVSPKGMIVETHLPWRRSYPEPMQVKDTLVEQGLWRIGFFDLPYRVYSVYAGLHPTPGRIQAFDNSVAYRLDSATFHSPVFPLTNAEWNSFIDSLSILGGHR